MASRSPPNRQRPEPRASSRRSAVRRRAERRWAFGMGRWRALPLRTRALALLGGLVALLAGVEIAARVLDPQLPGWRDMRPNSVIMQGHPTRLWGMTAGVKQNAGTTCSINELGLRGPVPETPRPPGRNRVLLLGDSAFFGHGVADDQTPAVHLESWLKAKGVPDVEVVNAAVAGYSIAQSKLLMEEIGWSLEPTLVLYANVWSDNTWDAFHDEDLLRSRRAAQRNPLTRSAAMRLIAAWLTPMLPSNGGNIIVWSAKEGWPRDRVRRVPIDRFGALTDEVIRQGAARKAGALLIKPSNTFLLERDDADNGVWQPYFQVMDALGACHGVPVVDLSPPLREAAAGKQTTDLFLDLMHPTPYGQAATAAAIGEALLAAGWPANDLVSAAGPCDLSGIEDRPPPAAFNDRGVGSPQANLFDINGQPVSASGQDFQGAKREAPGGAPPEAPKGPSPPDGSPAQGQPPR